MKTLLYGLTLVILYANLPQPFYENSMNGLAIIPPNKKPRGIKIET